MAQSPIITNPLGNFLYRDDIDGSPAWEFIHGQAQQKPMPSHYLLGGVQRA